jgi:hypothetical protein
MDGTNGLKKTTLGVNVFTAPGKTMVGERPKPFGEAFGFDPITSTLIFGEYDAVLVDAMCTVAEAGQSVMVDVRIPTAIKENSKCRKVSAESIPLPNPVATDVWNAWRQRQVGGFISGGVRSAGISDAVTVLRVNMRQSMRRRQGTRSCAALSRARFGFTTTRRRR